ncbi:phosphopantetheine-binding protein, partial [Bacillus thuringiensis]|uniref:phosphopantetheine-binding protein n=1 Tax=Bacillus thuringiensis TaxID=1428 RepID=UPI00119E9374
KEKNEVFIGGKSEMEKILSSIWEEVLKIDEVGVNDDLLALGGDWIKGIEVWVRVYGEGLEVEGKNVFSFRILRDMVEFVKKV